MTQDNVQDTQNSTGSIEDDIINETQAVNEMAFGTDEAVDTVAAENLVAGNEVPTETTPTQPTSPEVTPQSNDENRYQYWQSEADKAKNTIDMQNRELEALRAYRDHTQANPVQTAPQTEAEAPAEEEVVFPDPPAKPEAPVGYNRHEAMDDPTSSSARYETDLEQWRDNMTQYNTLHSQFMIAKQQEAYDAKLDEMQKVEARREAREQQGRQMQQIHSYVGQKYGLTKDEATEFVTKFSDPKSVNIKNLVDLYKVQKAQQMGQPGNQSPAPSPQFEQRKRVASVPSPMGVQTGQGAGGQQRNDNDVVMDSIINDYNKRNPF